MTTMDHRFFKKEGVRLSYNKRVPLLVILDSVIVLSAIFIGYFVLHPYMNVYTMPMLWVSAITLLLCHHLFASIYRLYQKAWEYASVGELTSIVKAVTFSIALTALVQFAIYHNIYFRALGIAWMIHVIL